MDWRWTSTLTIKVWRIPQSGTTSWKNSKIIRSTQLVWQTLPVISINKVSFLNSFQLFGLLLYLNTLLRAFDIVRVMYWRKRLLLFYCLLATIFRSKKRVKGLTSLTFCSLCCSFFFTAPLFTWCYHSLFITSPHFENNDLGHTFLHCYCRSWLLSNFNSLDFFKLEQLSKCFECFIIYWNFYA